MRATINNFEKAKNIYDEIIALDREIMDIGKLANEVANDDCNILFGIKVENHSKTSEVKKEVLDEDNSLTNYNRRFMASHVTFGPICGDDDDNDAHIDKYNFKFEDTDCLKVLEVLFKIKHAKREVLLRQLNKLGVVI